jgi:membrane fusion protein (multidrug efflux system)
LKSPGREAPRIIDEPAKPDALEEKAKKSAGLSGAAKKWIGVAAAAVILALGAHFAYDAYLYESTDNAMVEASATLLSSKVSGIIVRSDVQENQKVKAGQVLAEIRPDDYQNALNQAQSDMNSLAAQSKSAQLTYERILNLYKQGAASRERRDTAEAQYHSLDSKLQAAQAQVAQAKLNLDYTKIVAPTDGKVGKKSFEIGMLASPGQPLMGFVAGNERWVVANFKETQMDRIAEGKHATVEVDAIPGHEFEGVVESISPSTGATFSLLPPDNATGNFTKVVQRVPVRIKLLNLTESEIDRLQVGLSAEVSVKVR